MMNDVVSYVQEDVGFYPTPPELVEKMLEGVEWRSIKTVLEPSAGKGNIVYGVLNAIYKYRHRNWRSFYDSRDFMGIKIDCIEIDPNLRGVLDYTFFGKKARNEYWEKKEKFREIRYDDKTDEIRAEEEEICRLCAIYDSDSVRIVGNDFLNFITHKQYDLIVMNPPFEFGAEHLMRAIQIQEEATLFVCSMQKQFEILIAKSEKSCRKSWRNTAHKSPISKISFPTPSAKPTLRLLW